LLLQQPQASFAGAAADPTRDHADDTPHHEQRQNPSIEGEVTDLRGVVGYR
jgi:hypothetical protein